MQRMRIVGIIVLVVAVWLSPPACQSAEEGQPSPGLVAARKYLKRDAAAEFRENEKTKRVPFYSCGSLMYGDHFPGLSQEEVKLWIEERGLPTKREFQDDPAPFFVGVDFTTEDYWKAEEEFLTTYNQLVLAYLKPEHNQPVDPTEGTRTDDREAHRVFPLVASADHG